MVTFLDNFNRYSNILSEIQHSICNNNKKKGKNQPIRTSFKGRNGGERWGDGVLAELSCSDEPDMESPHR